MIYLLVGMIVVGLAIAMVGMYNDAYSKGYIRGKKDMLTYMKREGYFQDGK